MREPRATLIREILDSKIMRDMGLAAATPEPVQWRDMDDVVGPYGPFGMAWPIPHDDDDHPILIGFCPEIIDEQTDDLSDEELQEYLDALTFIMSKCVAIFYSEPDRLKRVHIAENEMYDEAPEAMQLVNRVQLRAVNARASN